MDKLSRKNPRKYAHTHLPICENCGTATPGRYFHVHHKDVNHDNNDTSNLELLCPSCHHAKHTVKNRPISNHYIHKLQEIKKSSGNVYYLVIPSIYKINLGWEKSDHIVINREGEGLHLQKINTNEED